MIKNRNKKSEAPRRTISFRMSLRDWRQALNSSPSYRLSNGTLRFQTKFVALITIIGIAALLYAYSEYNGNMTILNDNKSKYWYYNNTYPLTPPKISSDGIEFTIGLVADLDVNSKSNKNKYTWISYFMKGTLIWNAQDKSVTLRWLENPFILKSSYSLAGRGMELSELTVFNGKLLTFDDRTGIIYEIKGTSVIPWVLLMDGDGNVTKGFKSEWATVKEDLLYVGSIGKEWTSSTGVFVNCNPMWVKVIHPMGEVKHVDWENNYKKLRQTVNIQFPGYMIHESGIWSSIHKKWFFLPRRSSQSSYDEHTDEYKGTNMLLITDENFNKVTVKYVGNLVPTRGFSSFKFIPFTDDTVITALKSEEVNGTLATYITAFTIDGQILLPDTKVSDLKYEGIEFI